MTKPKPRRTKPTRPKKHEQPVGLRFGKVAIDLNLRSTLRGGEQRRRRAAGFDASKKAVRWGQRDKA